MITRIIYLGIIMVEISIMISPISSQCPNPLGGDSFIKDPKCPAGGQYQQANPRAVCTCVYKCGYRCVNKIGSPTSYPTTTQPHPTTTTPTTTTPTTTTVCPKTCDLGQQFNQTQTDPSDPTKTIIIGTCVCQTSGTCKFYTCSKA